MQMMQQQTATAGETPPNLLKATHDLTAYNSYCQSSDSIDTAKASSPGVTPFDDQVVPVIPASPKQSTKSVPIAQPALSTQSGEQLDAQPVNDLTTEQSRTSLPHNCRLTDESKLVAPPCLQPAPAQLSVPTSRTSPSPVPHLPTTNEPRPISGHLQMPAPLPDPCASQKAQQQAPQIRFSQWHTTATDISSPLPAIIRADGLYNGFTLLPSSRAYGVLGQGIDTAAQPAVLSMRDISPATVDSVASSTDSAAERIDVGSLCNSATVPQPSQRITHANSPAGQIDSTDLPQPPEVPRPGGGCKLSRVPRSTAKGWTAFTSFGLYARESVRALNQGAAPAHIEKLVGVMWSRLSAEEKQGWALHARCGRGGASQGSKPARKRPAKRTADANVDTIGPSDSGAIHETSGFDTLQKFRHHSLRSPRSPRRTATQLHLPEEDDIDLPVKWLRKVAWIEQSPSRHISPVKLDDLQLEVNTIETLAGMQAAAFANSRS